MLIIAGVFTTQADADTRAQEHREQPGTPHACVLPLRQGFAVLVADDPAHMPLHANAAQVYDAARGLQRELRHEGYYRKLKLDVRRDFSLMNADAYLSKLLHQEQDAHA
jgi:hypothetical protein